MATTVTKIAQTEEVEIFAPPEQENSGGWFDPSWRLHGRLFAGILLGLLLGASLWYLLMAYKPNYPDLSSIWIHGIYQTKDQAAARIKGPKLLLVGGSGTHFGLSARQMQAALNTPTVNYGTHAGLGIRFLLERTKQSLRPGDTVLLAPEYAHFNYQRDDNSDILIDYILSYEKPMLCAYSPLDRLHLTMGLSSETLAHCFMVKASPGTRLKYGYQAKTTDEFGDETTNVDSKHNPKVLNSLPMLINSEFIISSDARAVFASYFAWCKDNQIKVIVSYPAVVDRVITKEQAQQIHGQLTEFYREYGVPLIGSTERYSYSDKYFLDTSYHMTQSGVAKHTGDLLQDLRQLMVKGSDPSLP